MVTKKKTTKKTSSGRTNNKGVQEEVTLGDVKEAILGYFRGGWAALLTIGLAVLIIALKPIMLDQIVTAVMFAALATVIGYWTPRVLTRSVRPHLLTEDEEGRKDRRTIWTIRAVSFLGACLLLSKFSL